MKIEFSNLEKLESQLDRLPVVEKKPVFAQNEDNEGTPGKSKWMKEPNGFSLWTEQGDKVNREVVTRKYNVFQYDKILGDVVSGIRERQKNMDFDVHGEINVSDTGHKMDSHFHFEGDETRVNIDGDIIDLGLRVRSGHTGRHGVYYEVGATRLVCQNGMTRFVKEMENYQSHGTLYNAQPAFNAVDAVLDGPELVKERIEKAKQTELMNIDEVHLLVENIHHIVDKWHQSITSVLDNPEEEIKDAINKEVRDPDNPTLWDAYNVATHVVTHSDDIYDFYRGELLSKCAALIRDFEEGGLPDADELATQVISERAHELIENGAENGFEGEREAIRELRKERNVMNTTV